MRSVALSFLLCCGHALTASLSAQQCPAGLPVTGDIGIAALLCRGPAASCAINVRARADERVRHVFAVEPVITSLADDATGLRTGDALVAVDSVLITTAAGGARLAQLPIERPVRVLVRRQDGLHEIRIVTRRSCGIRSLRVSR